MEIRAILRAIGLGNLVIRKQNIFVVLLSLCRLQLLRMKWICRKKRLKIKTPVIHLYAVCWNEERIIPYFLEHYNRFVSQYFIYDNYSYDKTDDLLKEQGNITVIKYDTDGKFNDQHHIDLKNSVWKNSRGKADWVIVMDMDEFLYYRGDLLDYLSKAKETVFQCTGVDMYSEQFPDRTGSLIAQVKQGIYNDKYNKVLLFDPYKIVDINYEPGAHVANAIGVVRKNRTDFWLLHYKNLGVNYILKRIGTYRERLSKINLEKGWGGEYLNEDARIRREFDANLAKSGEIEILADNVNENEARKQQVR